MIKNIFYIFGVLSFLFFINYSYLRDKIDNDMGKTMLFPIYSSGFLKGEIRYENIIPLDDLKNKSGKIVIALNTNSVAMYKRIYDGQLDDGEFLINFLVKRVKDSKDREMQVLFGTDKFKYDTENDNLYKDIAYAILKLTKDGRTNLIGFAGNDYKIIKLNYDK